MQPPWPPCLATALAIVPWWWWEASSSAWEPPPPPSPTPSMTCTSPLVLFQVLEKSNATTNVSMSTSDCLPCREDIVVICSSSINPSFKQPFANTHTCGQLKVSEFSPTFMSLDCAREQREKTHSPSCRTLHHHSHCNITVKDLQSQTFFGLWATMGPEIWHRCCNRSNKLK